MPDAMETTESKLRLAIVGCGTVSERFHAPALRGFGGFQPLVMVDRQTQRAELLAKGFPNAVVESDYKQLAGRVDAAIIALPGHLNAEVAAELLKMGISVLVEKPAALTVRDAQSLAAAASAASGTLAVGFIRREAVSVRMARECIQNGMLGDITGFSIEDGYLFNWKAVNEFRFDRARGGGILYDIGSHVLDLLSHWFQSPRIKRYLDDCKGGVDTNAFAEIETAEGVAGTVELSWTRELRNSAQITGTRGTLEVRWYTNEARLSLPRGTPALGGEVTGDLNLATGAQTFPHMFLSQLQRWHRSLLPGNPFAESMADAADALRNIELIARCQSMREDWNLPWRSTSGHSQEVGR